jgi:hypothetical protein
MTIPQVIATIAAIVAGIVFGDECNERISSRVFVFVHATGSFLNSGQLRFISSLKNASWIARRLISGRVSIIVG